MSQKIKQEFEKWAILPAAIEAAQATLGATLIAVDDDDAPDDDMDDYTFAESAGVAIIPVAGVIGHKLGPVAKMLGAVDALDVMAAVELAAEDDDVDTIILDIDSPGGTVAGVPELAETVEAVQSSGTKKIYAYADSQMASHSGCTVSNSAVWRVCKIADKAAADLAGHCQRAAISNVDFMLVSIVIALVSF